MEAVLVKKNLDNNKNYFWIPYSIILDKEICNNFIVIIKKKKIKYLATDNDKYQIKKINNDIMTDIIKITINSSNKINKVIIL